MKKWLIILILIAIPVIGFVYYWINQPVETKVSQGGYSIVAGASTTSQLTIDNEYFSAVLPSGYKLNEETRPTSGPQKLRILTITTTSPSSQIAITIGLLEQGKLEYISDYNFRLKNPSIYELSTWVETNEPVKAFTKNNKGEITVFFGKGEYYAIVSISGASNVQDFKPAILGMLKTWSWKS